MKFWQELRLWLLEESILNSPYANKKSFDPVEKVVETLWFSIFFQKNAGKKVFYAPLDGELENVFGDAFSFVDTKVKVFEFKRTIDETHMNKERKKYQSLPPEQHLVALDEYSKQGHFVIALSAYYAGQPISIDPHDLTKSVLTGSYVQKVFTSPAVVPETPKIDSFLQSGLSLTDASRYFGYLLSLNRGATTDGGYTDSVVSNAVENGHLIGFFQDTLGNTVVVSAQDYLDLQKKIQQVEKFEQHRLVRKNEQSRKSDGPSMGM
jgi:hypothetical protein